jgi:phosphomannomutase
MAKTFNTSPHIERKGRRMTQTAENTTAPLIVSISGIRGILGASLTPQVVASFAACYGSERRGERVVVSRDGRTSGDMLAHAAKAGLLAVGCDVVDIGVAATPTCGFYVKHAKAAGGVQISASHNPPEWNGLKLFRREGFVLSPDAGRRVADAYHNGRQEFVGWEKVGKSVDEPDPHQPHLDRVVSLVDRAAIAKRGFRVVLDVNHGSGTAFGPRLLEALGCKVEVLGGTPDGRFEHPPEPIEANLGGLCEAVRRSGADAGFAVDPDADRLAIVDNEGRYIGEEYTLALAILHRTRDAKGPIVLNASTSRVSEDVAKAAGCSVFRTPVGEVHVAERMLAEQALIGGEGNGGVIDPRVGMIRDSAVGMALVLELLARGKKTLADVVRELPVYTLRKDKFPVDPTRLDGVFRRVEREFASGVIDRSDGLRIEWPDAWVQVRASNTEPIVRVFAESKDPARAAALCEAVGAMLD